MIYADNQQQLNINTAYNEGNKLLNGKEDCKAKD